MSDRTLLLDNVCQSAWRHESDAEKQTGPTGLVWDGSVPGWDQDKDVVEVASLEEIDEELEDDVVSCSNETSPNSIQFANVVEYHRRYASFGDFGYPLPNDETEQQREELKHHMLLTVNRGRLFYSELRGGPARFMELGSGAGCWSIDVGDKYQSSYVRAIDKTPIGPSAVPPNVRFMLDDCEMDDFEERDYDLVFARDLASVIRNVRGVVKNAFRCLAHGGFLEFHEVFGEIKCVDNTMPPDDPVKLMMEMAQKAYRRAGLDMTIASKLGKMMEEEGFRVVSLVSKKLPIGPWAKGDLLRSTGSANSRVVAGFFQAMAARPFHSLGMSSQAIEDALALAQAALNDNSVHRYMTYYFWWGQRP